MNDYTRKKNVAGASLPRTTGIKARRSRASGQSSHRTTDFTHISRTPTRQPLAKPSPKRNPKWPTPSTARPSGVRSSCRRVISVDVLIGADPTVVVIDLAAAADPAVAAPTAPSRRMARPRPKEMHAAGNYLVSHVQVSYI